MIARCCPALFFAVLASHVAHAEAPSKSIPLCAGLSIVTAISQKEGDYESIKTLEAQDANGFTLKYSSERPVQDFEGGPSKIRKVLLSRMMRAEDTENARLYLQEYHTGVPSLVAGTTAIGISRSVFAALKSTGEAEVGIFSLPQSPLSADPEQHPSVFDYQSVTKLRRVEAASVPIAVNVNGTMTELPALHAAGKFDGEKAEFYFLDDASNPMALRFRLGIGARQSSDESAPSDRDTLQVVKITHECKAPPPGESRLEQALTQSGRVNVYDIHFSFNSDKLRPESERTLREIADLLGRHAAWKLSIAGHTDAIGGDAANLDLSGRRADAVRTALVQRFKIDASRLATTGYGESQPVDTNETPQGRAQNRRVELVRQP